MIKKRKQLITQIKTPTNDLKGLHGVLSGAANFGASSFIFDGKDAGTGGFKAVSPARPEGNLPIA